MSLFRSTAAALATACVLAGCGQTAQAPSAPQPAVQPPAVPAALLVEIRGAGSTGVDALDVQPLRDPHVEDLLDAAERLEAEGDFASAAARIDQALEISADDPEILQRRAEYALMLGDWDGARQQAARSFELGPRLGPLCRRNWTTLRFAAEHAGDAAGEAEARERVAACTVEPPVRM
ncbi:tetratricopeptide repeat protein [Coralloluteibacterium thermophilus]|uniref:Tetratricopeptide repeat protein n=1 Tax=Coralloluteibacterium thermophilum TaxID=2707049 RepID=A0ABV9NHH2_9GAMM